MSKRKHDEITTKDGEATPEEPSASDRFFSQGAAGAPHFVALWLARHDPLSLGRFLRVNKSMRDIAPKHRLAYTKLFPPRCWMRLVEQNLERMGEQGVRGWSLEVPIISSVTHDGPVKLVSSSELPWVVIFIGQREVRAKIDSIEGTIECIVSDDDETCVEFSSSDVKGLVCMRLLSNGIWVIERSSRLDCNKGCATSTTTCWRCKDFLAQLDLALFSEIKQLPRAFGFASFIDSFCSAGIFVLQRAQRMAELHDDGDYSCDSDW